MEPPPLPHNQDCHELWSKRRKRQMKEAQQGGSMEQPMPVSYAQHRELVLNTREEGGNGGVYREDPEHQDPYRGGEANESSSASAADNSYRVPAVDAYEGRGQSSHYGGGGDSGAPHLQSSRSNSPSGNHSVSPGRISRSLGHTLQALASRQPVNYGHISSLAKEPVSYI